MSTRLSEVETNIKRTSAEIKIRTLQCCPQECVSLISQLNPHLLYSVSQMKRLDEFVVDCCVGFNGIILCCFPLPDLSSVCAAVLAIGSRADES